MVLGVESLEWYCSDQHVCSLQLIFFLNQANCCKNIHENSTVPLGQVTGEDEQTKASFAAKEQPEQQQQQPWSAKEAFQARLRELRLKYKHLPERYRGYEALLEVGDAPTDNLPQGELGRM